MPVLVFMGASQARTASRGAVCAGAGVHGCVTGAYGKQGGGLCRCWCSWVRHRRVWQAGGRSLQVLVFMGASQARMASRGHSLPAVPSLLLMPPPG